MTVKVRFDSVAYADTDWDDKPLAAVGDKPSVVVAITFSGDLKGGSFRIEHPGITPLVVDVPKRKATGAFRIGGRKPAPADCRWCC